MSKKFKPFYINFGPRDEYFYQELIEYFSDIPRGVRSKVAKDLMLQGLRSGNQNTVSAPPVSSNDKTNNNKNKNILKPLPLDEDI